MVLLLRHTVGSSSKESKMNLFLIVKKLFRKLYIKTILWPVLRKLSRTPELISGSDYRFSKIAREWSNRELELFSREITGDVINVSGWMDLDKGGKRYRDYFPKASSYTVSNYHGERGETRIPGEIFIDLATPIEVKNHRQFDLVFNHTTLEHIINLDVAFANLCNLSRDLVILVVPFIQPTHTTSSYGDYWRFTPQGLQFLFEKNGFSVIYESATNHLYSSVYLFFVASCYPDKWLGVLPMKKLPESGVGKNILEHHPFIKKLLEALKGK